MDTNRYDDAARLCDEIIEVAGDAISERIAVAVQTTLALLSTEYSLGERVRKDDVKARELAAQGHKLEQVLVCLRLVPSDDGRSEASMTSLESFESIGEPDGRASPRTLARSRLWKAFSTLVNLFWN